MLCDISVWYSTKKWNDSDLHTINEQITAYLYRTAYKYNTTWTCRAVSESLLTEYKKA